jgi:hypothetical protein
MGSKPQGLRHCLRQDFRVLTLATSVGILALSPPGLATETELGTDVDSKLRVQTWLPDATGLETVTNNTVANDPIIDTVTHFQTAALEQDSPILGISGLALESRDAPVLSPRLSLPIIPGSSAPGSSAPGSFVPGSSNPKVTLLGSQDRDMGPWNWAYQSPLAP